MLTLQPIISLTVFLKFYPLEFQEINHEKLYQRLFILWVLFNGAELFVSVFYDGTLCGKSSVKSFQMYGIDISLNNIRITKTFKHHLNMFLLVFPLILKYVMSHIPIKNKDKQDANNTLTELPKIPTVTAHNQKVLLRGSYFGPLVREYGIWNLDVVATNKFLPKRRIKNLCRSKSMQTIKNIENLSSKSNFSNGESKFSYCPNINTSLMNTSKNKYNLEDFLQKNKP